MSEMDDLPTFPIDDLTLDQIEHAMGGSYTVDQDGTHHLVGADFSLSQFIDFMAGVYDGQLPAEQNPHLIHQGYVGEIPVYRDTRVHYTEHDIIRALIAEVRRLRPRPVPAAFGKDA